MANEKETKHGEHNVGVQRAAVLGLLCNILNQEEESFTVEHVKRAIVHVIGDMIDDGHMVGDIIDLHVAKCCKDYIEKAGAVEAARDIVKKGS